MGETYVVQVLSAGGFGETYIAEDTRRPGNPRCVVKHLKPASNDPNYLQIARRLFNTEAETLENLGEHDQIPRLLAYFEESQEFYLVQQLIVGHPLTAELQPNQRWSESQVIQLLQDVLGVLEFVHSYGVIHRDLKPDNLIKRQQDGRLVLIDFGAVKQVRTQLSNVQGHISSTIAIGTPGYMPAEQGQGKPRHNSDIYALGTIGIQALTGLHPTQIQEDPDTGEMLWQHHAQVSAGLADILNKMVLYHYRDRYQSATEVIQAFHKLNNPYQPTQPSTPPGYTPNRERMLPTYTPAPIATHPQQTVPSKSPLQAAPSRLKQVLAIVGLIPFILPLIGFIVVVLSVIVGFICTI